MQGMQGHLRPSSTEQKKINKIKFSEKLPIAPRRWWRIKTSHIFYFLMAYVSQIFFDQDNGPLVKLLKIVRRMGDFVRFVAQPFNYVSNSFEEFLLFLFRIGIVISQKTSTFMGRSITKVDIDGL